MQTKPHYTSRSAVEVDNACRRKRFWSTVFGGRGLEPNDTSEEFTIGTALHTGPETLWKTGGDIEQAVAAVQELSAWNKLHPMWQYWVEGILRAYHRVRYIPQSRDWELFEAEEEVTYGLGLSPKAGRECILLAKPDLMLRHKLTGMIRYKEFKSTRVMNEKFLESWRKAVQLAAGELGYATRGIKVDQVQIAFFCKGEKADGYQRTPFLSAWRTVDGLLYSAHRPQKWKGWERFDVWQTGMTPAEWVAKLSDDDLTPELPETPELVFDPHIRDRWAKQTAYREQEIADAIVELDLCVVDQVVGECPPSLTVDEWKKSLNDWQQDIMDKHFPQNFRNCRPSAGFPCVFESICFNPTIETDPLASGLYRPRTPHHETEARALAGEE